MRGRGNGWEMEMHPPLAQACNFYPFGLVPSLYFSEHKRQLNLGKPDHTAKALAKRAWIRFRNAHGQ